MIIRKQFKFNGMHIVRNCSSVRCKESIHAHTYTVEVMFTGTGLDNGQMIMDFGLMKGTIKDFIGSFNNAYSMWNKEDTAFRNFVMNNFDRYITMPVSPSAEAYSLMFLSVIDKIVKATEFNNGEHEVAVSSVRVHETATGYAEAFIEDLEWYTYGLEDIFLSDAIHDNWSDPSMFNKLMSFHNGMTEKPFVNEIVEQQV